MNIVYFSLLAAGLIGAIFNLVFQFVGPWSVEFGNYRYYTTMVISPLIFVSMLKMIGEWGSFKRIITFIGLAISLLLLQWGSYSGWFFLLTLIVFTALIVTYLQFPKSEHKFEINNNIDREHLENSAFRLLVFMIPFIVLVVSNDIVWHTKVWKAKRYVESNIIPRINSFVERAECHIVAQDKIIAFLKSEEDAFKLPELIKWRYPTVDGCMSYNPLNFKVTFFVRRNPITNAPFICTDNCPKSDDDYPIEMKYDGSKGWNR